jgi:TFIIF-interacting CTD phosphatase-like protein
MVKSKPILVCPKSGQHILILGIHEILLVKHVEFRFMLVNNLTMKSKILFLLDLDHSLIYGSYAPSESADLLFEYSQYLKVYERPHAKELVLTLQDKGDIIVFTTAKHDYAKTICDLLNINPKVLLSRNDCLSNGDQYRKQIRKEWADSYSNIVIIDDSPHVWQTDNYPIEWYIPKEFRGDKYDSELLMIIEKIRTLEN